MKATILSERDGQKKTPTFHRLRTWPSPSDIAQEAEVGELEASRPAEDPGDEVSEAISGRMGDVGISRAGRGRQHAECFGNKNCRHVQAFNIRIFRMLLQMPMQRKMTALTIAATAHDTLNAFCLCRCTYYSLQCGCKPECFFDILRPFQTTVHCSVSHGAHSIIKPMTTKCDCFFLMQALPTTLIRTLMPCSSYSSSCCSYCS